jgi:hypothetical protein
MDRANTDTRDHRLLQRRAEIRLSAWPQVPAAAQAAEAQRIVRAEEPNWPAHVTDQHGRVQIDNRPRARVSAIFLPSGTRQA